MEQPVVNEKTIDLKDGWRVHEAPLDWGVWHINAVLSMKDEGWMPCRLPCDVHTPLMAAGIIRDPVLADYCFASEWIMNRSWWFVRAFEVTALDIQADVVELSIESIDAYGEIFINGIHIGKSINAHRPFCTDIRQHIAEGVNTVCVRVTTGLEQVSDADMSELNWATTDGRKGEKGRGDERRAFVRKPQYTTGWDWGPKVPSCGIMKGASVTCFTSAAIRGVNVVSRIAGQTAAIELAVEIESFDLFATRSADIEIVVRFEDREIVRHLISDYLLTSGLNYLDTRIEIADPHFWWPYGYGEQPLYEISASILCDGSQSFFPAFRYGIRTITLDTSRTDSATRAFTFIVNGVAVFCKGANWIPADSIYARVDAPKYERLIEEARNANFNMLRIWGGGIYEQDEFYEQCDRQGILIWHDFMFACSTYPDHLEWYTNEVDREMAYQTRRLRNHSSMALWCGNNENHWIFNNIEHPGWGIRFANRKQFGLYTANVQAKIAVRHHCPQIPYWNSSPYGGATPNSPQEGDVHHWHELMMNPDIGRRIEPKEYDKIQSRFVSEYGYPGPCPKETIEEYFDGQPIDPHSRVWDLHNNTFEKDTVIAGIRKHYLESAEKLSLDDYILYAGMVQSTMLGYSLESVRFKEFSSGALFWMFNDTWGEVGWTIVDYYVRRKVSFYGVKRALQPIRLIIRQVDGNIRIVGCNDSASFIRTTAEIGYLSLDGKTRATRLVDLELKPHSRQVLSDIPMPDFDYKKGVFAVIPAEGSMDPVWLRLNDFKEMQPVKADVRVVQTDPCSDGMMVTLTSDCFAHGVHAEGSYRCSDSYFDLLPGQQKTIHIETTEELCPEFRWISLH